ncbi:glycosyl transferase [Carbonactinospora thermoautotrophica]|uniref:glycosyltransferase family 4 protein n=1 Tax=Carbonactinospora thermoautotrophica TaxID=1469144 RepID=UPI00226DB8DA|nr:glycosyltransferase [Carbonactinospora thermoautotrophica]MCX9190238.1 glycosyl transferase [Carbonactinospora thermoautotrophica]
MRIILVGPTHPLRGGVAQHTTEFAHRLTAAGHEVAVVSWSEEYPEWLRPGSSLRIADDRPEIPAHPRTRYPLTWRRPDGWWRTGRELRRAGAEVVAFAHVNTFQAPAYLTLLSALRRGAGPRPRLLAVCHNVLPHERTRYDVPLARALLRRADGVLVHSEAQAGLARSLTRAPVVVASLPPHLPAVGGPGVGVAGLRRRLLFFGMVRPYKGVDVLLRALAQVPDVALTVAGEFWEGVESYRRLAVELGLAGRVTLRPGYVPAEEIPHLFAEADALVLPYRSGTATQNVYLAFAHGVPVVATRVGSMPGQVRDGVDGILCEPGDVAALVAALRRFYEPGVAEKLRAGVRPPDTAGAWARYVQAFETLAHPAGLPRRLSRPEPETVR